MAIIRWLQRRLHVRRDSLSVNTELWASLTPEMQRLSSRGPAMDPKLSVVFVNYNSTDSLVRALASLEHTRGDVRVEVIVVDNGSDDQASLRMACGNAGARLVELGRNLGYGAAANRGARLARARYLAVANPDVEFLPEAVSALVRFLDEYEHAGVVGPRLEYPDGTFHPSARRLPRLRYVLAGRRSLLSRVWPGYPQARKFLYLGAEDTREPVKVEAVVGTFMVFRHQAFDEVGGFDERFFMFAEDVDICRRLGRNWGVYFLPQARVVHAVGASRRRAQRLSEFHRLRSHRLFFIDGAGYGRRILLDLLFVAYTAALFAAQTIGIQEYEHSWRQGKRRLQATEGRK